MFQLAGIRYCQFRWPAQDFICTGFSSRGPLLYYMPQSSIWDRLVRLGARFLVPGSTLLHLSFLGFPYYNQIVGKMVPLLFMGCCGRAHG